MSDWLYLQNGRTLGPVSEKQLLDKMVAMEVDFDTNIMDTKVGLWKRIREVQPIMDKFNTPSIIMNCNEITDENMEQVLAGELQHNIYFFVPIKRILLMTIASFGLYQLYWWYKQWSYWAYKRKQVRSFDREAGWFLFPLMVLDKIQLDEELNKVERADFDGRVLFWGWILIGFLVSAPFIFLHINNHLDFIMYASSAICTTLILLPAQKYINRVNEKLGNQYEKPGFGHYLCLAAGSIFWISSIMNLLKYFITKG
jgi:hypothetical protein